MVAEINVAIKLLAEQVKKETRAEDALKFTQAALNLAHTLAVLESIKRGNA